MNRSIRLLAFALIALAIGAAGSAPLRAGAQQVVASASAPPTPPPINTAQTPLPGAPNASPPAVTKATPSPLPDLSRKGIGGVWEVQIQHPNRTIYTHFKLLQQQNVLTGTYLDTDNKRFPCAGSLDGKQIRLVVTKPDGSTITFAGEIDGATDMLGVMDVGEIETPFTAAYRPKFKFIDSINPGAGY